MKNDTFFFKESRDKDNVLSLVSISFIIRKPNYFKCLIKCCLASNTKYNLQKNKINVMSLLNALSFGA